MFGVMRQKLAAAQVYRAVRRSGLFDPDYYLRQNLDVARRCVDPLKHYLDYGWLEGRNPNPYFNTGWYLKRYPDVLAARVNPFYHYLTYGWREGHEVSPEFSDTLHLVAYLETEPQPRNLLERFWAPGRQAAHCLRQPSSPDICPEPYQAVYQDREDFSGRRTDIKAIAFYLPQFHRIPENDRWWGEGFTDWTNTRRARPLFEGHYQPREPHPDIGYYDLSDTEVMKQQARLCREHGIYGLCFYHYWFHGKRLLEKPVDQLLEHPEIDLRFCLCWANENWTRTWDGLDNEILIAQAHSPEDDIAFIRDLCRYMRDPRYIRLNGKPIVLVYRPLLLPEPERTFARWRQYCRDNGLGEILIWGTRGCLNQPRSLGLKGSLDAEVEFPPGVTAPCRERHFSPFANSRPLNPAYSYKDLVQNITSGFAIAERLPIRVYRTCMLGWDNTPRRGEKGYVFCDYSTYEYYRWLRYNIEYTRKKYPVEERFVFINAWNEWAEGTYLEPDRKYGYVALNTTSRALFDLPYNSIQISEVKASELIEEAEASHAGPISGKIAVHAHLFYPELAAELIAYMNKIPDSFDCYITTDTESKRELIERALFDRRFAHPYEIRITPNIGRDVAPFLVGCGDAMVGYDLICHIHSKKSLHNGLGDLWRQHLLSHLLGSRRLVRGILNCFAVRPTAGLIAPSVFPPVRHYIEWGSNRRKLLWLSEKLGFKLDLSAPPVFSAGTMMWMRKAAFENVFKAGLTYEDFETESGQVDGTLAHAFERLLVYIADHNGYSSIAVS